MACRAGPSSLCVAIQHAAHSHLAPSMPDTSLRVTGRMDFRIHLPAARRARHPLAPRRVQQVALDFKVIKIGGLGQPCEFSNTHRPAVIYQILLCTKFGRSKYGNLRYVNLASGIWNISSFDKVKVRKFHEPRFYKERKGFKSGLSVNIYADSDQSNLVIWSSDE